MYIIRTKNCLKYRLAKEANRGRLLDLDCVPRGIGKTELLMNLAKRLDYTVIVCNSSLAKEYSKVYGCRVISQSEAIRDSREFRSKYLVDERVNPEIIKFLKSGGLIAGGYFGGQNCLTAYKKHGEITRMFIGIDLAKGKDYTGQYTMVFKATDKPIL